MNKSGDLPLRVNEHQEDKEIMNTPFNKEKLLLDRLGIFCFYQLSSMIHQYKGKWTRQQGYTFNRHEQECIDMYESEGFKSAALNIIFWSTVNSIYSTFEI